MFRIAHISDLHISELDLEDLSNLQWLAKVLGKRLKIDVVADKHDENKLKALKTILASLGPDLIVVTGDVTNFGDEKSFDKAAEILAELKETSQAQGVICIPGNHDSLCERVADLKSRGLFSRLSIRILALLNQEVAISDKEAGKLDGGALTLLDNYRKFSTGRYAAVDPSNPVFVETSWGEIAFFLFNSTNDRGVMANEGRIGEKQYDALNTALSNKKQCARIARAVRIALLHHHPISVPDIEADAVERGYNWMTDGLRFIEYVGKRLENQYRFHFILHGHQHVPHVYRNAPGLNAHIIAAGSALAGSNPHHGSFNIIDLISPFEARVRRFDYSPTGYAENRAKAEEDLPVRPIGTVRIPPSKLKDYLLTGEDLALQGTVKGAGEAYDTWRRYDLLEYNVTVTPDQNYTGVYRRRGKIVSDTRDEGIVFVINGNPPKKFADIGVTATGKSSKDPAETPLEVELIADRGTRMVFRVRHKSELRRGDTFDISMKFNWQSSQDFPNHFDGLNLLFFKHPVGRLVYKAYLPWEPANPQIIAQGVTEDYNVHLADSYVAARQDGIYLYYFEINSPRRLPYVIAFGPRHLQ